MSYQTQIYHDDKETNFKKCAKCGSYFVTDSECESCGHQLKVDQIGAPFGVKSFYFYREDYLDGLPFYAKKNNFLENKKSARAKKYSRKLFYRFNDFIQYIDYWYLQEEEKTLFYLLELEALIKEMFDYGISLENIKTKLDKTKLAPLFSELILELELEMDKNKKKVNFRGLMNARPFGLLSMKFYFSLGLLLCFMVFLRFIHRFPTFRIAS